MFSFAKFVCAHLLKLHFTFRLIGCLFPLPRILYAMSSDGLLFGFLARVNARTKIPIVATMICGFGAGFLSSVFNLEQLVDMASIGTFQSYILVCICVLILRCVKYLNIARNSIKILVVTHFWFIAVVCNKVFFLRSSK